MKGLMNAGVWALVFQAGLALSPAANASGGGGEEAARRLREAIAEVPAAPVTLDFFQGPGESYKLPVSRGFAQLGTQLCWVYSTLNALESRYLYLHGGGNLELSRGAMQYLTMRDRIMRK